MTKTPEEMAEEFADEHVSNAGYILSKAGFLAGYQAAKDEYETKMRELEIELENWKHTAIHGDEGL